MLLAALVLLPYCAGGVPDPVVVGSALRHLHIIASYYDYDRRVAGGRT